MSTRITPEERKLAGLRLVREEQQRVRHQRFLRGVLIIGLVNAVIAAACAQSPDLVLIGFVPAGVWFVSLILYADVLKPLLFPPEDAGMNHGHDWPELIQRFSIGDRLGFGLLLLVSYPLCRQLFKLWF